MVGPRTGLGARFYFGFSVDAVGPARGVRFGSTVGPCLLTRGRTDEVAFVTILTMLERKGFRAFRLSAAIVRFDQRPAETG